MFNRKKKQESKKENAVSSIAKIEGAAFPILPLPFNGTIVFCKVRCLNKVQLMAIGEFNLIDINNFEDKKVESIQDMVSLINWQEALVKETLVSPSFEEIHDKVYGKDNRISTLKNKLKTIREKIKLVEANKRAELEKEANSIELYIGSLLPTDFMNAITSWATGVDRSDIKKLTRNMLLEAAILAHNGKDNPADHMQGDFLEFHKDEINKSAWIVYNEYLKEKELENKNTGIFKNYKMYKCGKVNYN